MIHLRDLIILRRCRDAILAAQVVISEECGIDLDDDIDGLALRTAAASMNAFLDLETTPGEMELLDQHAAEESAALAALLPQRKCRVCGCVEQDCSACIERTGERCHWVEDDLCSACQAPP